VIVATRGGQFIDLVGEVDGNQYGSLLDLADPERMPVLTLFQTILAQGGWVESDEEFFDHEQSDAGVTVKRGDWVQAPGLDLTDEQIQTLKG
jgi:hypothetical protein